MILPCCERKILRGEVGEDRAEEGSRAMVMSESRLLPSPMSGSVVVLR